MKLPSFRAIVVAISALLFTQIVRADDLKDLAGTWKVESANAGAQNIDSDDLKAVVVKIMGDKYEVKTKDNMISGTLKLDETQKPKTMDATQTEGLDAGKLTKAIYEITGDTLRVCYALQGAERPKEFATKEGSPFLMMTYKREKKAE